jgi:hypothetical protein
VTHPEDETLYFKTLEALWNKQFDDQAGFKLPDLAFTTFVEYSEVNTSNICKNCGARLQIFTAWWSNEPKPIRPSTWFQVHHKNFQHFDNRLENLEYLCGNCHGAKGQWDTTNRRVGNWHHGMKYVRSLIDYLQTRGISLTYIFLSEEGRFSWAVIGERQD